MTDSNQMEFFPTSLPADSLVKTLAPPENKAVSTENGLDYGQSSPELLAKYDHDMRSWKTSQLSLLETEGDGLAVFSETWPRSGTMQNGIAYRLPTLAHRIGGIESGLLPTPTSSEGASQSSHNRTWSTTYASLQNYAMGKGKQNPKWPTPKAADSNPAGGLAMLRYNQKTGRRTLMTEVQMWPTPIDPTKGGGTSRSGNRIAETPTLHGMARKGLLWPTPKASPSGPDYARAGRAESGGDDLATVVAMWPTPKHGDYKIPVGHKRALERKAEYLTGKDLPEHLVIRMGPDISGQLNPTWVEWLMGFPLGWTDLKHSETL